MKTIVIPCLLATLPLLSAEETRQPDLSPEQQWLQQLVGEWVLDVDVPAGARRATESIRALGDHWIVVEGSMPFLDGSITYLQVLGYGPAKQQVVGNWVDSTSGYLWNYTATLDEDGKTLSLEAEGPGSDGQPALYRDHIVLEGADRLVRKNWIQGEGGEWTPIGVSVLVRAE